MTRWFRTAIGLSLLALASCGGAGPGQLALPARWQAQDVDSVGFLGGASHSNGLYTVAGSGSDIWDTADGFRFIYRALNGDGEMIVRGSLEAGALLAGVRPAGVLSEPAVEVPVGGRQGRLDVVRLELLALGPRCGPAGWRLPPEPAAHPLPDGGRSHHKSQG